VVKLLSDEDLVHVLPLLKGSNSVELKVTVPEDAHFDVLRTIGVDPLDARMRQVFFFDTADLTLDRSGVVVRARRIQDASADTTVKLRPVVPDELPEDLRHSGSIGIEVDMMPGGFVCSASMKGKATNDEILETARGQRRLRKLFSKEQRVFLEAHAPEGIGFENVQLLGPTFVLKQNFQPPELGRRLVAELWFIPDGSRVFELSTKCLPAETFQVAVAARAYLEGLGLDLSADPNTKTKTTLDFFAAELQSSV